MNLNLPPAADQNILKGCAALSACLSNLFCGSSGCYWIIGMLKELITR